TVRLACEAGAVGGSIEDTTGDKAAPIYPFNLAVERVQAAVELVRTLPVPFVLTARAENFLHGRPDLDDTIKRLQAFEKAGAEVLFAPFLPSLDAIRTVVQSVSKPVNVVRGGPGPTIAELAAVGVRRVSVGGAFSRLALTALKKAGEELLDRGTFGFAEGLLSTGDLNKLMREN